MSEELIKRCPLKDKIKALRHLQIQAETKKLAFEKHVHKLKCDYEASVADNNKTRMLIICGKITPSFSDSGSINDSSKGSSSSITKDEMQGDNAGLGSNEPDDDYRYLYPELTRVNQILESPGVPSFWMKVLMSATLIRNMITAVDQVVLNHLEDIHLVLKPEKLQYFRIDFYFSPNEYFTNGRLTKEYFLKKTAFKYGGEKVIRSSGCHISWKKDKDLTIKKVETMKISNRTGKLRARTEIIQNDSFFNAFALPEFPEELKLDKRTAKRVRKDFKMGLLLKNHLIPNAFDHFIAPQEGSDSDPGSDGTDGQEEEEEEEDVSGSSAGEE